MNLLIFNVSALKQSDLCFVFKLQKLTAPVRAFSPPQNKEPTLYLIHDFWPCSSVDRLHQSITRVIWSLVISATFRISLSRASTTNSFPNPPKQTSRFEPSFLGRLS